MRLSIKVVLASVLFVSLAPCAANAQAGRNRQSSGEPQKKVERKAEKPEAAPTPTPEQKVEEPQAAETGAAGGPQQEIDTVKIDTNLVTVPVIVSDRGDKYISDLKQEEFSVFEDGAKQEISFFETVTAPFHVVLMLDTSASTEEKLGPIQQAAIQFTDQLQKADRVKVISFDDQVYNLSDFSSDRAVLRWAIRNTRPGGGTVLYDAFRFALDSLRGIKGRKAIVLFTDGVDYHSNHESYDRNRRMLEEAGVIVYPIRYDTRAELERLLRQQTQSGQVIDLGKILGGRSTTTPTTFPGSTRVPTGGGSGTSLPRMPGGVIISGNKRTNNPNDPTGGTTTTTPTGTNDTISTELDHLYLTADAYLNDMANVSGGQLYRADTLLNLPRAFEQIAAELRTQYLLGYYPSKATARDGKFHKIKVSTTRKSVAVRARPGYRAPAAAK